MIVDRGFDSGESGRLVLTRVQSTGTSCGAWIRRHSVHQSRLLTALAAAD